MTLQLFFLHIYNMDTKTNSLYPTYSSAQVIMSYSSILSMSGYSGIHSVYVCMFGGKG